MKRLLLLAVCALVSCTDAKSTIHTLQNAGFSDVEILGYAWFECGEDDTYHTEFRAKNPKGVVVEGTVCCGMLSKGCTIRF